MLLLGLLFISQFTGTKLSNFRSIVTVIFGAELAAVSLIWNAERSLSPDPMIWLLPVIVIIILTNPGQNDTARECRALVISALAALIKLSSAPILLYCLVLCMIRLARREGNRRVVVRYLVASSGLVGLLLLANIMASGCPGFPSPVGCISADWSVGHAFAVRSAAIWQGWANSGRYTQIYWLLAISAASSVLAGFLRPRDPVVRHGLVISWMGIAFIFATAPLPRYSLGYFLFPTALALAVVIEFAFTRYWSTEVGRAHSFGVAGRRSALAWAGLIAAGALFVNIIRVQGPAIMLLPVRMAKLSGERIHVRNQVLNSWRELQLDREIHGSITLLVPTSSDQCWDAPVPCTPSPSSETIGMRRPDKGFGGGFSRVVPRP
jgi:hypothetical protein